MQSDPKSVLIGVLSADREEQEAIAEAMGTSPPDLAFAPTVSHLRDLLLEQPRNGLLLCVSSLVGLDPGSKRIIETLEQVYPVVRVRWDKAGRTFGLFSARIRRVDSLSDFVAICSNFAPRRLRHSERLSKTLNVLISPVSDMAESARAFTMNSSARGCFVHTTREWKVGDSVYIQVMESLGKRVIEGRVTRLVPWGVPFSVQGIGIQFVNMGNEQAEELERLLY